MLEGPHSLPSLPVVVLDCIFEKLDLKTLASLSGVSRGVHGAVRKHLYQDLSLLTNRKLSLVERTLRRDPTLIRYVQSFKSVNVAFFKWFMPQAVPTLKRLDVDRQPNTVFDQLHLFNRLTRFSLRRATCYKYTLQMILEQLHCPSLEYLEVDSVSDWRINWRSSFATSIPNLISLRLKIGYEARVMFDNEDDDTEKQPTHTNIMWESVLTLRKHCIFLDLTYYDETKMSFLSKAPSYASRQQLDPVPLIQWLVRSEQSFRRNNDIGIFLDPLPFVDLSTILAAVKPMDFDKPDDICLSISLPIDTSPALAFLLHESITYLLLKLDSNMDPTIIPKCIQSLRNLRHLKLYPSFSNNDPLQTFFSCTAAKCLFPTILAAKLIAAKRQLYMDIRFSRLDSAMWAVHLNNDIFIVPATDHKGYDFEREVEGWFDLSISLQRITFEFEGDLVMVE